MKTLTFVVMLISALARAGEGPVHKPVLHSFGPARYAVSAGWKLEETGSTADASWRFTKNLDTIELKLLGGQGSRYTSPSDYLSGMEATTMGKAPEKLRQVQVAGLKVWLFRHGYPINLGDPHVADPHPPQLAQIEFCIIPYKKNFFLLSWTHASSLPDLDTVGKKAWEFFLTSFTLEKK